MGKTKRQHSYDSGRIKKQEAVLKSIADGATMEAACKAASITSRAVRNWILRDPTFAAAVRNHRAAAISVVYDAMFRAATGHQYAERKVVIDDIYENGFPKKGPKGGFLVKRTRSRVNKEVQPSVAAADLWLRNHDKDNYIQRTPEVIAGFDKDDLLRTMQEPASAFPEPEKKEKDDGEVSNH